MDYHEAAVSDYHTRDAVVTEAAVGMLIGDLGCYLMAIVFGNRLQERYLEEGGAFRGRRPMAFAVFSLLHLYRL